MNMRVSMHVKGRMYVSMFRAPATGYARVNSGHGKSTAERTFQTHSYLSALDGAFLAFSVEIALVITSRFIFLLLLRLTEAVKFRRLRDISQIIDGR